MAIKTKKAGAYVDPVGIFAKKNGVYAAVQNVFVKVAGAYQAVLAVGPAIYYSMFSYEIGSAATASALRIAMTNTKRVSALIDNPATNVQTMEYVLSVQTNNNRNPPGTGWAALIPGTRATITDTDATKQMYVRVASASTKAVTAATCSGTAATLTVPNHGITGTAVRAFEGITPGNYNIKNVLVTATDANTLTCTLLATTTVGTAFGYMYDASECVVVTTGETA